MKGDEKKREAGEGGVTTYSRTNSIGDPPGRASRSLSREQFWPVWLPRRRSRRRDEGLPADDGVPIPMPRTNPVESSERKKSGTVKLTTEKIADPRLRSRAPGEWRDEESRRDVLRSRAHGGALHCGMLGWNGLRTRSGYGTGLVEASLSVLAVQEGGLLSAAGMTGPVYPRAQCFDWSENSTHLAALRWCCDSWWLFLEGCREG